MIAQQVNKIELIAHKRDFSISPNAMRKQGLLPVILYGRETDAVPLSIPFDVFEKLHKEVGETTIIDLKIEGESKPRSVLIKNLQFDPVTDNYIHIDLYQIKVGEKLRATVPLRFVGESLAVKDLEGILVTNKNEIEVECLPKDLPRDIEVDISVLKEIDDSIILKDLKIPKEVELLDDIDESIIVVTPPTVEEEVAVKEETVEAVVEEGKEDEEGEADIDKQEKEKKEDKTSGQEDRKSKS